MAPARTLDEANERLNADFCLVGVQFLDFCEAYAMPRAGEIDPAAVRAALGACPQPLTGDQLKSMPE